MKKNVLIKLTCCLFMAVLFVSCSNFLDSSKLKNQLEDNIAYAQAESVTVRLAADDGTGTIYPSGDTTFKLGYESDISFEENSAYVFSKWRAYEVDSTDETEILTDAVEFSDVYSLKTTAKVLKTNGKQIKIKPVCYAKPYISSTYPQYPKDNIVSNTSAITVSFAVPNGASIEASSFYFSDDEVKSLKEKYTDVSFKSDTDGNRYGYELYNTTYFKNITITSGGYSVLEHFGAPVLSGKLLLIPVDTTNPILTDGANYKDVTVTISTDIYAELSDGTKLTLADNSSNTWNYRVSETAGEADSATIQISSNSSIDKITPAQGTYSYDIGTSFTLSTEINSAYTFNGWQAITSSGTFVYDESAGKSVSVLDSYGNVCLVIEDAGSLSTTVSVKKSISNIVIIPVTEKIPVASIVLSSDEGKISPSGTYNCQENSSFDLYFTAESAYAFSNWKVKLNGVYLTENEAKEYFDMDYEKPDTVVKVLKAPSSNIQLIPVCNVRPKILSYAPGYDTSGVYRDTRIKIIFDSAMSSTAFWWTQKELTDIGITELGGYVLFKCDDSKEDSLIYAYAAADTRHQFCGEYIEYDEETITYRNIDITNRETSENLLAYYKAPYFESSAKDVLIIPSKTGATKSVPESTDVKVVISKYAADEKNVILNSSTDWCYFVNLDFDDDAPAVTINSALTTYYDGAGKGLQTITPDENGLINHVEFTKNNLTSKLIRTDGTFTISGEVNDSGSRPSEVKLFIKKLNSAWYDYDTDKYPVTNGEIVQTFVQKLSTKNSKAAFSITVDDDLLSKFSGDGIYEISFAAYDNNDNEAKYTYEYVYLDQNAPDLIPELDFSNSLKEALNIDWKYTVKNSDLMEVTFTAGDKSVTLNDSEITAGTVVSTKIAGLTNGTIYDVKYTLTDVAGNKTEGVLVKEGAGVFLGAWFYQTSLQDGNPKFSQNYYEKYFNKDFGGFVVDKKDDGISGSLMTIYEKNTEDFTVDEKGCYYPAVNKWCEERFGGTDNVYAGFTGKARLPEGKYNDNFSLSYISSDINNKYNESAKKYGFDSIRFWTPYWTSKIWSTKTVNNVAYNEFLGTYLYMEKLHRYFVDYKNYPEDYDSNTANPGEFYVRAFRDFTMIE